MDGELRIYDLDLARRLGFAYPLNIRNTIKRHEPALRALGVLFKLQKTSGPGGGRPTEEYYLNRTQAIYVTDKSEPPPATDTTIAIIERFDAFERGDVRPSPPTGTFQFLTPDDRSVVGGIIKRVVANQIRPLFQMQEIDNAHIVALKREIAETHSLASVASGRSPARRVDVPIPFRRGSGPQALYQDRIDILVVGELEFDVSP